MVGLVDVCASGSTLESGKFKSGEKFIINS
jgi:hypothetical protein